MNKIYLGDTNLNVLKLGSGDTVIYLGNEKIYPLGEPEVLQWVTVKSGDCIDQGKAIYGVRGNAGDLVKYVGSSNIDGVMLSPSRNNVEINVFSGGIECYSNVVSKTDDISLIFGDISCADHYNVINQICNSGADFDVYMYAPPQPIDYSKQYLTTIARESGTIVLDTTYAQNESQYSLDEGVTWSTLKQNTNATPTLQAGDRVMWRGLGDSGSDGRFTFSATTIEFDVEGNPMSLHYDSSTDTFGTACSDYDCKSLFKNTKVVDASNLDWGTVTTKKGCFQGMFKGCTSLTKAPSVVPAPNPTSGSSGYCQYMFDGCTSLTDAPQLPATSLSQYCYNWMFYNCTSLQTAPELPALTLSSHCYENMFNGCSSLNYIKAMFTTTPSSTYTLSWVKGVAATGTFVKNSAATWTTTGTSGIPTGWTVQDAS